MTKVLVPLQVLAQAFGFREPALRQLERRGAVEFAWQASLVVVDARLLVRLALCGAMEGLALRGGRVRALWDLLVQAFEEADRTPGERPHLVADLSAGTLGIRFAGGDGPPPPLPGCKTYDLLALTERYEGILARVAAQLTPGGKVTAKDLVPA